MANGQNVDTSTVKVAGDQLDAFANQVSGRLRRIKQTVEDLTKLYQGKGSTAFQQSMMNWDATALNVRRDIFELAGQVRKAGVTHQHGDEAGQQSVHAATRGTGSTYNLGH
jgi:WXG100 family type VII secretion target